MSKSHNKPNTRPSAPGQQKQGSAKPVAAPKPVTPLAAFKMPITITPLPTTSVLGPSTPAAPEPLFTYQMKVFIPEGVLDIYGTTPQTKSEIQAKYEAVRDFGAVFNNKDGGWTTYMPRTIAKIIVILTPVEGGSGEDK